MIKKLHSYLFIILFGLLTGCATVDDKDPMEGYNRAIFAFNETADEYVAEPVAKAYVAVVPEPVVKGINNFFNNIRDFITFINDILQLKGEHAINDGGRVVVNTTIGLLGFIDVHSMNGGERRKEDFGQTLAFYGWENSAYFVLPLLGPSTVRDTGGLLVDSLFFDPISYIENVRVRNAIRVVQFIDARAELLNATAILDEAALDPYAFQRDSYLQYRERLINDEEEQDLYGDYNMLSKQGNGESEDSTNLSEYELYLSDEEINMKEDNLSGSEKVSYTSPTK
ncbi:MAG: VacJ family lipoprotein [Methylophilaceae bacterium]|nr:VacJ family lipoprotein [Methylophilaceae bacterium]